MREYDNSLASKQASKQARVDYIDLFRAFGIILMIMGYIGFGSVFSKWIHAFHMPMFFIISGYFYKEQLTSTLIRKRFKTVLLPYIVFGIVHCVLYFVIMGKFEIHSLYLLLWNNTAEGGIPIAGALWFLTSLFFSEVFYNLIYRYCSKIVRLILVILVSLFGMTLATYLPFRLPWALKSAMVGVGFLYFGHNVLRRITMIITLKGWQSIIGAIIFSALALVNGHINLRTGQYAIWPLFWINAIGLSISFLNLTRVFYRKISSLRITTWFVRAGNNSIVYLCLNQLVIYIISGIFVQYWPSGSTIYTLIRQVVILGMNIYLYKNRRVIRSKWNQMIMII